VSIYVVTGGAGFIGSNIVTRLVAEGQDVRVVDDLSTGHRENLAAVAEDVRFFEGSVCDSDLLATAFDGADYVLHQAALASVPRSVEDPVGTGRVNVEGTLRVFLAARDAGVKRVVFASSSSVYGDVPTLPKREDMAPQPMSPYAVGKLTGEHYASVCRQVFGTEITCLRYFNVFGPRQDPNSQYAAVIPIFIRCLLAGQAPHVYGDGEQSRDFTFVDDVVQANLQAATAEGADGAVCNLGCGTRYTLNELLSLLQGILGTSIEPDYGPERPGDVRHSMADISRAREAFGYNPRVSFEEGLRRTVAWFQEMAS
jgi:UDP-glucose 4-epimerase